MKQLFLTHLDAMGPLDKLKSDFPNPEQLIADARTETPDLTIVDTSTKQFEQAFKDMS